MNFILQSDQSTRYMQVYDYYKELILSGKLPENQKMPSIRRCAQQLDLSKTTIETAYLCLAADGYIISRPQSGYYVTKRPARNLASSENSNKKKTDEKSILYNFTSNNVDEDSFDFSLWRRYIKSALRQDKRMLTYGEPQGEYDLRETICQYVIAKRNAVCTPEHIIIGAGFQSLLHILCPLLKERQSICFQDSAFGQGMVIFEDYGFTLSQDKETSDILYMTPSNMTSLGDVMSVEKRLQVLNDAITHQRLIIEDDYNNEFRYFSKPRPCLQGLAGGEQVIYISTFSKLLLPSIRLSFMILPNDLLSLYEQKKNLYNQTASKAEQLALCQFLRDGHLDSQIRKLKRLYSNKAKILTAELEKCFGKQIKVASGDSVSMLHLYIKCNMTNTELCSQAKRNGILVFASPKECMGIAHIALSCCEVPASEFPTAVGILKQIVTGQI